MSYFFYCSTNLCFFFPLRPGVSILVFYGMNTSLISVQGYQIRSALFQTQPWDGCAHGGAVFTGLSKFPKPRCQSIPRDPALCWTNNRYHPTNAGFWLAFFQRRIDNPTTTRPFFFKHEWTPGSRIYDGYYPECARERQEHCLWWISTGEFYVLLYNLFFWFFFLLLFHSSKMVRFLKTFSSWLFSRKITIFNRYSVQLVTIKMLEVHIFLQPLGRN